MSEQEQMPNGAPPGAEGAPVEAEAEPEQEPKKRPLSRRIKKAVGKWLAMALIPPIMEKWLRLFNYNALKDNEKILTLIGHEEVAARVGKSGQPTIIAFWHNRLMFGPTAYQYCQGRGAVVMVSRSFDGDIIEATLTRFKNLFAVRGSSQSKKGRDKGGQEALEEMIEKGRQGLDLVITPDGPLGPRYQVKRGIIDLAKATGLPIYPAGTSAQRTYRVKSWDQTVIPNPWSPCVYKIGKPITVPADADEDTIERKRQELEKSLLELTEFVDRFYEKKG